MSGRRPRIKYPVINIHLGFHNSFCLLLRLPAIFLPLKKKKNSNFCPAFLRWHVSVPQIFSCIFKCDVTQPSTRKNILLDRFLSPRIVCVPTFLSQKKVCSRRNNATLSRCIYVLTCFRPHAAKCIASHCLMLFSSCCWAVTEGMSKEKKDRCNTIQTGAQHKVLKSICRNLTRCSGKQIRSQRTKCNSSKTFKARKLFYLWLRQLPPPCFKVKLMPWTCESLCKINGRASDMLRIYDAMIEVAHLFPLPSDPSSSLFMEMYSYFPQHILLTHR